MKIITSIITLIAIIHISLFLIYFRQSGTKITSVPVAFTNFTLLSQKTAPLFIDFPTDDEKPEMMSLSL